MKRLPDCGPKKSQYKPPAPRNGASSIEIVIAFTLLGSVLACSTPLIVRHQRLVAGQREYRLALDEVSNQLERLSVVPRENLTAALTQLRPADFVSARLSNAQLHGEVQPLDIGQRVRISLSWGDEQRSDAPVTLTAWFLPEAAEGADSAERGRSR